MHRNFLLVFLLAAALIAAPAGALMNPAAGYCTALGYNYSITTAPDGTMTGFCTLPGNRTVDEWQFLQGQVAPEFSYCAKQGYRLETVNDRATCRIFLTDSCAVCVLADGSKTEVTKLMNLDFRERLCSNGKCCDPKTDTTCSFATGMSPGTVTAVAAGIAVLVVALIAAALYLVFRKKPPAP